MKNLLCTTVLAIVAISMSAAVTPHYSVELGYDHGLSHLRTTDWYYGAYSWFVDEAKMDGFHVGGNVQLDFLQGQHMPSMVIGLNYQFLGNDRVKNSPFIKDNIEAEKIRLQLEGATDIKGTSFTSMHTLQIPVRVQYTYQITNDWRFYCYTGPQVRLHLAFVNRTKVLGKNKGEKYGSVSSIDYVSGKVVEYTYDLGDTKKEEEKDSDHKKLNCFDMSWGFGVGFGWKFLSLALSYDLGMVNVWNKSEVKEVRGDGYFLRFNSDALAVTLGFRIK